MTPDPTTTAAPREVMAMRTRIADLEALVKVLSSGPTTHGSESFQRVRDQINPRLRALLMEVLCG